MPDSSPNAPAPFEGLTFLTVRSAALRGRGDITLFVPPEAREGADMPVALLLHGAFGSHWNWTVSGGAHRTAQRMILAGELPLMILVMPSDGLWGDGSGYLTHPKQDFEKWIVEDVPAAVQLEVPSVSEKSPLFLGGLSMGGFGALRIAAKFPGFCRGVSAHSSITHFDQLMTYVAERPEDFGAPPADYSVLETMLRHRATLPPIRFDCGATDALRRPNRQLHADMDAHGLAHQYEEFPGGHDWNYWTTHLEDSFRFFAAILNGKKSL